MLKLIRERWCQMVHGPEDLMHPFDGKVKCRRCHVERPVDWAAIPKAKPDAPSETLRRGLRTMEEWDA